MFIQKDSNLWQRRWFELLNDYDTSHYSLGKANVFVYTLSRMNLGSVSHVGYDEKDLVKDVHRLPRLCVSLGDSPNSVFGPPLLRIIFGD